MKKKKKNADDSAALANSQDIPQFSVAVNVCRAPDPCHLSAYSNKSYRLELYAYESFRDTHTHNTHCSFIICNESFLIHRFVWLVSITH